MDNKDNKAVEKWQVILQWACAVIWIVVVVCDLVWDQNRTLTILQCIAAAGFLLSAIITTKRYRRDHHA